MHCFKIVVKKQFGFLQRSTAQTNYIEKQVPYHLGRLKVFFADGILDKNYVENLDEAHFVFNMDIHHTFVIFRFDSVNFADVGAGADAFITVLCLIGGSNARLKAPFIVLVKTGIAIIL